MRDNAWFENQSRHFRREHAAWLTSFVFAAALLVQQAVVAGQQDEGATLPFTTTDQVVIRKDGALRTRTVSGVIEDMSGESIILRRTGNVVDVFRLREVVSVRFQKSAEFDEGLRKLRERDWNAARTALKFAEKQEPRQWVVREIQAALSQAQRALGQFEESLETIEKILKVDPESRHVVELPLVWDERLPKIQRIQLGVADLQSASIARQLTAASALLQDPANQDECIAVLQKLRKSTQGTLQRLAESQFWRMRLLHPEELRESEISSWRQQVRFFDRRTRSGPEFIIGRALLAIHDYDNAATSLLWMPLLEPLDPATTASSLTDAIMALDLSGRTAEAAQLRIEFLQTPRPAQK